MEVTACLVTRGDVPIGNILDSWPETWERVVWDNSVEYADLGVYGRYAAIREAQTDVVFVQDDDCLLPPESFKMLCAEYRPGVLTVNMPERFRDHYSDSCLLGFGAIFDRELPELAFDKMTSRPPDFERVCDVYFTTLTPAQTWLDLPYTNLAWAEHSDRMYRQPDHVGSRAKALERARDMR